MTKREEPLKHEYKCLECGQIYSETQANKLKTKDDYYTCAICGGHITGYCINDVPSKDNVNKPQHYLGKIETIDFIKDKLTQDQFVGYCIGNVLKYLSRFQKKNGKEDLEKAQVYLGWAIENYKNNIIDKNNDDIVFSPTPKSEVFYESLGYIKSKHRS